MTTTTEQTLHQAVASHKEGKLQEAERLYRAILQTQPRHPDANHNLGLILFSLDNTEAALPLFKTALDVNSKMEQFWISYIEALIKAKQFNHAKRVLKKAKKFKFTGGKLGDLQVKLTSTIKVQNGGQLAQLQSPLQQEIDSMIARYQNEQYEIAQDLAHSLAKRFPDHHSSWKVLGAIFAKSGKLDEALVANQHSVKLNPLDAEAHSNLAATLQVIGRLEESVSSCNQAIKLNPDSVEAYTNLGISLFKLGRLDEAEASNRLALKIKPDYAEAFMNLSVLEDYRHNTDKSIELLENILRVDAGTCSLRATVNIAILKFLADDFITCKKHLLACSEIQLLPSLQFKNYNVYRSYLLKIIDWHEDKPIRTIDHPTNKKLYVVGESHALVSQGLRVQSSSDNFLCESQLIQGCKQWDLGNSVSNPHKTKFEKVFQSIPKHSEILLVFGEIDCRLDSGIIKHHNKRAERNISELMTTTVLNYLAYVHKTNAFCNHNITIQAVPCPIIDTLNVPEEQVKKLTLLIKDLNICLKNKSIEMGYGFLDVHALTDRGDGLSNHIWHIDDVHLTPDAMLEAWRINLSTR